MSEQKTAYIALGGNVGDRNGYIAGALDMLRSLDGIRVESLSDIIETKPLAGLDQPKYLNTVARIKTTLNAEGLLKKLHQIEDTLGRKRAEKFSSRTIDLDVLLFGDEVINTPDLTIPHPQMHLRSFVLKGLCQLNANLSHPVLGETIDRLAVRLSGNDFVMDSSLPQVVSIAGVIGVGKTTLAQKLSASLGCEIFFEPYDTNPFMPDVYAGKKELALDSQLYFLISRLEQLNPDHLQAAKIYITDYVFDKELIYARLTLTSQQQDIYNKLYESLMPKATKPVLVIHLKDSLQRCLERIHSRNRPYEQKIGLGFLKKLAAQYERLFAGWKKSPVIRIDISGFNCNEELDIEHLIKQIKSYIAQ